MATITVRGDFVHPESQEAKIGERLLWVGPPSSIVKVNFGRTTPVEWHSKEESPGVPVRGTIQDTTALGTYKYKVGDALTTMTDDPEFLAADPEIIVSGGVLEKPATKRSKTKITKRTKGTKGTKGTKAKKRAKTSKRTKMTKRTKTTKRTKATKRAAKKR